MQTLTFPQLRDLPWTFSHGRNFGRGHADSYGFLIFSAGELMLQLNWHSEQGEPVMSPTLGMALVGAIITTGATEIIEPANAQAYLTLLSADLDWERHIEQAQSNDQADAHKAAGEVSC